MDLTKRQHEITDLVAQGFSNKEIARLLNVAEGTIKIHLHTIYDRFKIPNRTALAAVILRGNIKAAQQ